MPRPRRHPTDLILDSARDLILEHGLRAATVAAISSHSGAPVGSIYHRFGSIDRLLAEVWIRAARRSQAQFLAALEGPGSARERSTAAGLSVFDFARTQTADARLLTSLRRADLIAGVDDAAIERQLQDLNRPLQDSLTALSREIYGQAGPGLERVALATVDLPLGAVRRHLLEGKLPPPSLRPILERAIDAALAENPA